MNLKKNKFPHFPVPRAAFDTPAFKRLTPSAMKLYFIMLSKEYGEHNGHLWVDTKTSKEWRVGERTHLKALRELETKGFIEHTHTITIDGLSAYQYKVTALPDRDSKPKNNPPVRVKRNTTGLLKGGKQRKLTSVVNGKQLPLYDSTAETNFRRATETNFRILDTQDNTQDRNTKDNTCNSKDYDGMPKDTGVCFGSAEAHQGHVEDSSLKINSTTPSGDSVTATGTSDHQSSNPTPYPVSGGGGAVPSPNMGHGGGSGVLSAPEASGAATDAFTTQLVTGVQREAPQCDTMTKDDQWRRRIPNFTEPLPEAFVATLTPEQQAAYHERFPVHVPRTHISSDRVTFDGITYL